MKNFEEKVKELKALLDKLEIFSLCDDDGVKYGTGDDAIEIDELASSIFIKSGGRVNYDAIHNAVKYGVIVSPGETDSFGWLTGVVRSKDNDIRVVFG